MSGTFIKVNGEWRYFPQDIKKNGSWEDVTNAWIKENGAWTLYRTENVPVEYLVVAGGGGGSSNDAGYDPAGGGGGAGGYLTNVYGEDKPGTSTDGGTTVTADTNWDPFTLTTGAFYPISVGGGGARGDDSAKGGYGGNSTFASIVSTGGGGGGGVGANGNPGGSGGGKGSLSGTGTGSATGVSGQGRRGGRYSGSDNQGAGGGGAGQYPNTSSKGGDGLYNNINGTSTPYAGGGGSYAGSGGVGGGGNGGTSGVGGNATANTGGGGGGSGNVRATGGGGKTGGLGGSGVVIFRIPSVYKANFDAGIEFSSNRYDVPNYAIYNVTSGIGSFSIGYFDEFYTENSLFTFGWNNEGQLGDGTTTSKSSLTQISGEWIDITNGINFTVGIKKDGTLWAWGHNNLGQLGTGTVNSPGRSTTPLQIGTDTNWQSVKAGSSSNADGHILALKTNGTLWAWGNQNNGQLGNGLSSGSIATPTRIGEDTDWASISAGDRSSAAIKTNGDLYMWGRNNRGQLGDGTTTEKPTPTRIGSGYKKVSCGKIRSSTGYGYFTVAIKTDGTLWAWGDQTVGQLGNGASSGNETTPQQIGSDTDWDKIATGGGFTLAIKTNKTLWGWGRNNDGQLGDGTKTERTTPTQIGSGNHWKDVDCGERSALMITDGALWGTGLNNEGQISHLTTDQPYPLQISSSLETAWKKVSMGYRTSAVITGV